MTKPSLEGPTVREFIADLRTMPQEGVVSLALMETAQPPHNTIMCLMVTHESKGAVLLSAPLDLSGLPSQRNLS